MRGRVQKKLAMKKKNNNNAHMECSPHKQVIKAHKSLCSPCDGGALSVHNSLCSAQYAVITAGLVHLWWPSVGLGPPRLSHVGFLLGPLLLALLLGLDVLGELPGEECADEEERGQAEQHVVDELAGALGGPFDDGDGPSLDDVHHCISRSVGDDTRTTTCRVCPVLLTRFGTFLITHRRKKLKEPCGTRRKTEESFSCAGRC
uniref:Uncharacterized protein n=1 Tax=Rhipicephalus zambeziensis TaxID=60191 RepID=A0A224YG40_9ACAR